MIETENYEKSNFIMNNFKFIKKFPDEIKKINIKSLKGNVNLENVKGSNITVLNNLSNNILIYKDNNKIYLLNDNFEEKQVITHPISDKLLNFGYNCFLINNYLSIIGIGKGKLIIYIYKLSNLDKYELHNKIVLEDLKEHFYPKYINNKLILVQYINDHLLFYNFKLTDTNLEKENIVKMKIKKGKIILAFTKKHIFLNDSDFLYIIKLNNFKLIEKKLINCLSIESFETTNNYLTIITEKELVTIYDDELNVRQIIKKENVDTIQFNDSYLILFNSTENLINIFALNENGIFIEFAKFESTETITDINYYNNKVILSENNVKKYFDLPKRIYNEQKLLGYGFSSEIKEIYGRYLLLNNGRLSTKKMNESLLIGYTNNISDIIVNNERSTTQFSFKYHKEIDGVEDLKQEYIIISDEVKNSISKLNKNSINFIFIEDPNIELFLSGKKGSSININIELDEKIITWSNDGIIKLNLLNNASIIQIKTKSDIKVLGYNVKKDNKNLNYSLKIISENNDVLINDKILSSYQTFFPYVDNNKISGLVNEKITDIDVTFDLIPINTNLVSYNSTDTLQYNNLNQQFYKRYLIENNNKSIQVTDLYENKKIMEYKIKNITGIKKIIYVNPILLIFSKPENEIDTFIHLINSNNNKILPYVISNNENENITDFFAFDNNNLIFITNDDIKNIIYLINFDNSYEVNNIKKIIFNEDIISMKLFDNYLAIQSIENEIIIYDIIECKSLISFKDDNIISFDIKYNIMAVLLYEDTPIINIYEIKPDFQLIIKKEIEELSNSSNIFIGPGRIVIDDNKTYLYKFNKIIGLIKIDTINENFIHYYKNLLVTTDKNKYKLYKISPNVNYTDNMINCQVRMNKINIKNKYSDKTVDLTILLKVNSHSKIKIANEEIIEFNNICKNKCIAKLVLKLQNTEDIIIESTDQNTDFCGIIVGDFRDKLPCFLPGTLVDTPNGKIIIEELKENNIIYNDLGEEVVIEKIHSWTTTNFTKGTIPYIIPKDSLEKDYPIEDLYVSPFHKIRLPNGDFVRVCNINLPLIKQFKNTDGVLKYNNKEINEITYYNFILSNNSNFIANGIPVESLDRSNHLIN